MYHASRTSTLWAEIAETWARLIVYNSAMREVNLLTELRGSECRCGNIKKPDMTLCGFCYRTLPRDLQNALYKRMGHGYENAYAAAADYLDAAGRVGLAR